ncbi:hypothetical protein [Pseudoroseicyclus sp. CXY001]|uniref:hypothetical protein n=1 Tax=Pseudoroseicyclus sp. CXY001 TaxID=3242492 RepID=UPI00357112C8
MRVVALFLWVLLPLGLYGIYATWGTPHIIASYMFLDNGARWDPLADRTYTSCTFIGWTGVHTVAASNGKCGWFRFFKEAG